ncbi:hypothetical protein A9Q73_05990 [Bermanella sp. 47_1433_sub80_T6]|nr:hypothetical protein A9Q73_05990 [Bermanella sp. 47_1433_sub80_T6]
MINSILLFIWLLSISLFAFSQEPTAKLPKIIHLATTDWCPYACDQEPNHQAGIVHEYLTGLFSEQGIQLKIEFFPWSRAIHQVNGGRLDGLLTAVPIEAPNLLFTRTPTMGYQVCFYSKRNISWRYSGAASLKDIKLGVIQDYGYGQPVDEHIKNAASQDLAIIKSGGMERLQRMLMAGRFHVFIGDRNVVSWRLKENMSVVRNAGCLAEIPFYMAFNPQRTWAAKLINKLNGWLKTAGNQARLNSIKMQYRFGPVNHR